MGKNTNLTERREQAIRKIILILLITSVREVSKIKLIKAVSKEFDVKPFDLIEVSHDFSAIATTIGQRSKKQDYEYITEGLDLLKMRSEKNELAAEKFLKTLYNGNM